MGPTSYGSLEGGCEIPDSPLEDVNSTERNNGHEQSTNGNYLRNVFFFCVIISVAAMVSMQSRTVDGFKALSFRFKSTDNHAVKKKSAADPLTSFYFTASNEYGQFRRDYYSWLEDVPGSQIVEPYKSTTLTIGGSILDSKDPPAYFTWQLSGTVGTDFEIVSSDDTLATSGEIRGSSINVKYYTPGKYTATISAMSANGRSLVAFSTLIIVKYVKRELRTLTDTDRDRFLDAAAILWKYTTEEGKKIYGDSYTGIETFTALHINASNDRMCDSYHEGSGFLFHHLALTNAFEASLRSVDPSVTLPYWDFTIEGQAIADAKETPSYMLQVSPFFSDTWFGSVDENNHIQDSRWAHIKIPMAPEGSARQGMNSFGQLRSYWNNNGDEEIVRHMFEMCGLEPAHKKVPSCSAHYAVLNAASLGDFQMLSPSDGHGPVHIQTGGLYGGCADAYNEFSTKWSSVLDAAMTDEELEDLGFDPDTWGYGKTNPRRNMFEKSVMGEYFHIYRAFWRSHMCANDSTPSLLECPETCDSTQSEDCGCAVNKLVDGTTTWENLYPCVLEESKREIFNAVMPSELLQDMVTFIATSTVLHGDMIESSSANDIIFWLIHPSIERMLSAKRLATVTKMGDTEFSKWSIVDGSNETWLEYTPYTFGAGENGYYTEGNVCRGHAASDPVLTWKLPLTETVLESADADGDGEISNRDYYLAMDPNNVDGNDYVWDHFDWDHCEGVEM